MFRLFIMIAVALCAAAPASAQAQHSGRAAEASAGIWRRADGRITFVAARISFPARAGSTELRRTFEIDRRGEGVDTGLQYESADQRVLATVYVYLPGLAHGGLAAFMTDRVIRQQSRQLEPRGIRAVPAGGREDVAIRADYGGYRDQRLASSAAFIKADRWIVKLRVSGPEVMRGEVEAAMDALLAGVRFEGEPQPRAAEPLAFVECGSSPVPAAASLTASPEEVLGAALLGLFDAAGVGGRDQRGREVEPILPRVGTRWCEPTIARIGEASYALLRAPAGAASDGLGGRSVLIVPMTDAGRSLELVEMQDVARFVLLHHAIGITHVLGAYAGPLSDQQVIDILSGADREGNRIRSTVRLRTDGGSDLEVPSPEPTEAPPST